MDFASPRAVYLTVLSALLPTLPPRLWPGTQGSGFSYEASNGSGGGMVKHGQGEKGRGGEKRASREEESDKMVSKPTNEDCKLHKDMGWPLVLHPVCPAQCLT